MRTLIALFLLLVFSTIANAQQSTERIQERIDSLRTIENTVRPQLDSLIAESPNRPRNTIFLEGLGNGGILSLNVDHRFHNNWSFRTGIGLSIVSLEYSFFTLPLIINYLTNDFGSPGHLEVALGIVPSFGRYSQFNLFGPKTKPDYSVAALGLTTAIGYRYQPVEGGFNFRIGFMPLIYFGFRNSIDVTLSVIGLSLGYTF
ncbi:MAG: hypothetical protein H9535_13635 [Ignavibacteria bacterium]|nr:hypothetical protein [Ignavibacteria bacterium]